jgi:Uma2 family endonuclease
MTTEPGILPYDLRKENLPMATTKLWTIDEVAQLPDDEHRYALIRGELIRMPPTQGPHGLVVLAVGWHLYGFVREHGLGLVYDQSGFILGRDPDTLLGPDLSFVSTPRLPANLHGYPEVVPDLVVEVASPSQSGPSIEEKTRLYLEVGVRLVWIFDPMQRTVRVRRADGTSQTLTSNDTLDGEDVLPGFRASVAEFFTDV